MWQASARGVGTAEGAPGGHQGQRSSAGLRTVGLGVPRPILGSLRSHPLGSGPAQCCCQSSARGTPVRSTLGCSPIPGCSNPWGHRGPSSLLPCVFWGPPSRRSSTPTPTPRWGGRAGSGFGKMGRVSMATERDDDSRHGEAAWPGPLPWRCAWHSESPWRWPRDGAVPMAWGPGLGWDGGKGVSRGLNPPIPRRASPVVPPPARCRLVPGAAAAARDHFHEAFPLQFTLPSDRPNFSFSE